MDRAEAVMDKTEKKVLKSKGKARTVQDRAKNWDELNKKMLAEAEKEEALALEKENWVDEDGSEGMEDVEAEDTAEPMAEVVAETVPLPNPVEEDEL